MPKTAGPLQSFLLVAEYRFKQTVTALPWSQMSMINNSIMPEAPSVVKYSGAISHLEGGKE